MITYGNEDNFEILLDHFQLFDIMNLSIYDTVDFHRILLLHPDIVLHVHLIVGVDNDNDDDVVFFFR